MIYIYTPNVLFLLVWIFYFKLNILLSLLLTPISYLVVNGFLIYKQQFNLVHSTLDKLIVFSYLENIIYSICSFIVFLIFKLPYVNHLYAILKVKILVYLFNLITSYIPSQKINPLTEELQNDYLEILNKNRKKRSISPAVGNINKPTIAGGMD
jgi:hypothetical protein